LVDITRSFFADAPAFGAVFIFEAALFFAAALMAMRVIEHKGQPMPSTLVAGE
jgi:BCD family chlorophyll transporter-like MFS transporter